METNGITMNVMEAFLIKPAGKSIRVPGLQIIEELKRIDIGEILIRRSNQLTVCSTCNSSLDIWCKQTETRLFDEADRKIEALAHVNVSLQLIYKLYFAIICKETTPHILPRKQSSYIILVGNIDPKHSADILQQGFIFTIQVATLLPPGHQGFICISYQFIGKHLILTGSDTRGFIAHSFFGRICDHLAVLISQILAYDNPTVVELKPLCGMNAPNLIKGIRSNREK